MKTTARFFLSAATGLGLAAFTLFSAFVAGANAPVTVIAFALLAIYGMIEIAILSYSSPRFLSRPAASQRAPTLIRVSSYTRVPAIVEMSKRTPAQRAA